jgi:formamidopyrimidine-DNA glycosylase
MPELPEVEGARRRLEPLVVGRKIERLDVRDPKLWHAAEGLEAEAVAGLRTQAVTRRAKILRFELERGLALLLHLKIAGQIAYRFATGGGFIGGHPYPLPQAELPDSSTRFTLHLEGGDTLFLNDQRRFAWLRLLSSEAADEFIAGHKFGPDPLDPTFTPEVLLARLQARKGRPLKAALLDQTCITGLGNIYADESLHGSNLHPMMRAGDVTPNQAKALHTAIRTVLDIAVPVGGAYVVNGRAATPPEQMERDFLRAHGRAGLPCPDCGPPESLIRRDFLAGRGTYWCVNCQPVPAGFVVPTSSGAETEVERADAVE